VRWQTDSVEVLSVARHALLIVGGAIDMVENETWLGAACSAPVVVNVQQQLDSPGRLWMAGC
jgi:hypothetical protein